MTAGARPPRSTERRATALLARALRLRCPNCGRGRMFESWFRMRERCDTCGLVYERGEHDYFIGAYLLNLIIAELHIAVLLLVLVLATWPEVPWTTLMWVIGLLTIPGIFVTFPFSRSLWLALDLVFRPAEASDFETMKPGAEHPDPRG
jgi:uncharacterized protein (DUF983 family)